MHSEEGGREEGRERKREMRDKCSITNIAPESSKGMVESFNPHSFYPSTHSLIILKQAEIAHNAGKFS